MNALKARGHRMRSALALVVGVLLVALMVYPWPEGTETPIILGVVPAPLFFWMIWTALFVLYVAWVAYRWDPNAAMVRRANAEHQARTSLGGSASTDASGVPSNGEER